MREERADREGGCRKERAGRVRSAVRRSVTTAAGQSSVRRKPEACACRVNVRGRVSRWQQGEPKGDGQPTRTPAPGGEGDGGRGRSARLPTAGRQPQLGAGARARRAGGLGRGRNGCSPERSGERRQTLPDRSRPDTQNDHSGEGWQRLPTDPQARGGRRERPQPQSRGGNEREGGGGSMPAAGSWNYQQLLGWAETKPYGGEGGRPP